VVGVAVAWVAYVVGYTVWSRSVEGSRKATDALMRTLMWTAFVLAMLPLVSLIWTVVARGLPVLTPAFLHDDMSGRALLGVGGGIYHAIMGTVMVTAIAATIAIPIGLFTAIYLVEYGKNNRLAKVITFLVDVMTGIPSIVAGLFAIALFIVITGDPLPRLGIGGAVALAVLMLPTVIRSVEEMLKLVPDDLREASYALGVPKWRTIVKVVLPTAIGGIITGIMLATARVIGETAPLLVIAGKTDSVNFNLFGERMTTLPVYIYYSFTQPGTVPFDAPPGSDPPGIARAWGAALVLIVIVMALNLVARLVGRIFAVRKG
jgi:phosphate transport system permease protein